MDEFFSTKFIKRLLVIAIIMGVSMLIESQITFKNATQYKVLQDSITTFYKEKNQNIEFGFFVIGDLNIFDENDSTYKSKLYFKIYNDFEKKSVVGVVFNKKETSIYTIQSIKYED
jgi:hypothetical protein